jgi:hypothetical protein
MKFPVQLILRPAAAKLLGVGLSTCKRHEKTDPDHPKPVLLSRTRIAYRADELADYQRILQRRAQDRPAAQKPGIARDARKHGLSGANKRKENAEAAEREKAAAAKQTTAGRRSAVLADIPATGEPKQVRRSIIPSAARAGINNPAGAVGEPFEARHAREKKTPA